MSKDQGVAMEDRRFAPKPSYSAPKAAKILGVGTAQLYRAIKAGEVKTFKVNGRERIPGAWIEKQLMAD
jgi:hypothetical protein